MRYLLSILFFILSAAYCFANTNDTITESVVAENTDAVIEYFTKYGIEISSENYFPLYEQIYKLKDIPYKYSGRSTSGLDCSGFTICIFDSVFNHKLSGGSKDIFHRTKTIPDRKLKEGDLLFFKIKGNAISHIGIYLGNGKFAHATAHGGVMINDISEPYYKKYYFKATRTLLNTVTDISE